MKKWLAIAAVACGLFLAANTTAEAQHFHGHRGGGFYNSHFSGYRGGYGINVGGPRTVISVGFGNVGGIGYGRPIYGGGYYVPVAPVYRPVYPVGPIYGGYYGGGFNGGCNRGGYYRW